MLNRVLITTSTLPRWSGDVEPRFVLDLARHLRPWYEPTILSPATPGSSCEETLEGVRVIRYRYAPTRRLEVLAGSGGIMPRTRQQPLTIGLIPLLLAGLYAAIRRELLRNSYQLVHAHWLIPQGLVQSLFNKASAPPFVVTSHGGDFALQNSRLLSAALRHIVHRATRLTVVAPDLCDDVRTLMPGFPADTVPVIPMGVDTDRFSPGERRPDLIASLGLSGPIILFVGRLVEKKGAMSLVEAFAREPLRGTSASLLIIGDGPQAGALRQRVAQLGLGHRIRLHGALSHSALPAFYASADIFCAPSVRAASGDRDGTPTVLCEAAASGLPLVGTDFAGAPLIIVPNQTGLLVKPGDPAALAAALASLVRDPARRQVMGRSAAQHAENFAWPVIARRPAEVFDDTIATIAASRQRTRLPIRP